MKQVDLQKLFRAGAIRDPVIVPALKSDLRLKWNVQFEVKQDDRFIQVLLYTKRDTLREFSSIDSAFKASKEIGFKSARIES